MEGGVISLSLFLGRNMKDETSDPNRLFILVFLLSLLCTLILFKSMNAKSDLREEAGQVIIFPYPENVT